MIIKNMRKNQLKNLLSLLVVAIVVGGIWYYSVDSEKGLISEHKDIRIEDSVVGCSLEESEKGCSSVEVSVGANSDIHNLVSPQDFKEKLDSGEFILVDIRTPKEFDAEKISGAINIDFYNQNFEDEVDSLDKSKKYLYYCRTGHRSGLAGNLAEKLGFNEVYELEGGITKWKELGYPTEK